jgi:hypothetical protein
VRFLLENHLVPNIEHIITQPFIPSSRGDLRITIPIIDKVGQKINFCQGTFLDEGELPNERLQMPVKSMSPQCTVNYPYACYNLSPQEIVIVNLAENVPQVIVDLNRAGSGTRFVCFAGNSGLIVSSSSQTFSYRSINYK